MEALKSRPIIYVTRDIERALGMSLDLDGYFIISNSTLFGKMAVTGHANALLIEEPELLDTYELLKNEKVIEYISKIPNPNILVFKNTLQIERICQQNNWKLLNPPAALAAKIEEKNSQVEWLGDLAELLPPHAIKICKKVEWPDEPFILQFNRAHTGNGTLLITSFEQLQKIQTKFLDRPVRVTKYISGPMFTSNNIVTKTGTLVGNISYQITGLAPFTDQPFATIGNDWALPRKLLSDAQIAKFHKIVQTVGLKLQKENWRGLFGVDIILDEMTRELYLIEINARQPASATFESQLQNMRTAKNTPRLRSGPAKLRQRKITNLTIFEEHMASLLDLDLIDHELIKIDDGAQIILRNSQSQKKININSIISELTKAQFQIMEYANTKPDSDFLRIQSCAGIMKKHGVFNKVGTKILNIIEHGLNEFN